MTFGDICKGNAMYIASVVNVLKTSLVACQK